VKAAVKVIEITDNGIKYKKFDNLDGPSVLTGKANISSITYANGTKDTFCRIATQNI
jgi:hypothetical protein